MDGARREQDVTDAVTPAVGGVAAIACVFVEAEDGVPSGFSGAPFVAVICTGRATHHTHQVSAESKVKMREHIPWPEIRACRFGIAVTAV